MRFGECNAVGAVRRGSAPPSLEGGEPSALFTLSAEGWRAFDVAADGRFLAAVQHVSYGSAPLAVVVNWTEGLHDAR